MKQSRDNSLFGPLGPVEKPGGWVDASEAEVIRVAFEAGGDHVYDYALAPGGDQAVAVGQRVLAPLGRGGKEQMGFCVELPAQSQVERLRVIHEVVDQRPLLDEPMMALGRWISQYYCCSLGAALAAMVPAAVKRQVGMVTRHYVQLTDKGRTAQAGMEVIRLSAKGRAVLEYLASRPDAAELPVDEVTEALGCGKGPLTTLARQGLVTQSTRRELPGSAGVTAGTVRNHDELEFHPNEDQRRVLEQLSDVLSHGGFQPFLLHGVTGSGKTEVYIRAIEQVVAQGGQALVLVPEIALTPQTERRFLERFESVAVLHSGLSNRYRHVQWRMIADGSAQVVVGARSAVFAPLPDLKLIIVDEEHEGSYKQDTAPRYHGRDVAIKRAQLTDIPVILGSATPSLESFYNSRVRKNYRLLELPRRVMDLPMPPVTVVNMREEFRQRKGMHLFSIALEKALRKCLDAEHQAIILLNRRGHSSYIFCSSCQFTLTCPNCDVGMTCHKRRAEDVRAERRWIMCHYCGHSSQIPEVCPVCSKTLRMMGPGTQHAEEELARKLPEVRFHRVDSDAIKPGQYEKVLDNFGSGNIDVLLGTQMIGKGLDFPNVKLVGVLNADTALALPDFRSSERTFQLIAQVAGRCGRATADSRVIVQSFLPDDPAIELACEHDYLQFAEGELVTRKACAMPPYRRLARIIMRDRNFEKLEQAGRDLRQGIDALQQQLQLTLTVRGPAPAPIATIENYHRQEILLAADTPAAIQQLLALLRTEYLTKLNVQAVVDVDPLNLL